MSSDFQDPYCWPGTDVLSNKLGIHDSEELAEAEAAAVVIRDTQIRVATIPGQFNLRHLKRFHAMLFGDIYSWAGELRTVDIDKGVRFAHHAHLGTYLGGVLEELSSEKLLMGLSRPAFVERLGYYLGEVNAAHPFREGNGRTQRAFFRQLGAAAGYTIHWDQLSPQENIRCSYASLVGDETALVEMLDTLVEKIPR